MRKGPSDSGHPTGNSWSVVHRWRLGAHRAQASSTPMRLRTAWAAAPFSGKDPDKVDRSRLGRALSRKNVVAPASHERCHHPERYAIGVETQLSLPGRTHGHPATS